MATANASWPDLLEPGLRERFTAAAFGRPSPALSLLFGIRDSSKLREHYLGAGAMAPAGRFDGSVAYDDMKSGWKTSITNLELARGFIVQRSWVDDEMYGAINDMAVALGDSFATAHELDAADVFNQAFSSTTYRLGDSNLGADGVVLCSASHPLSPINAGSVQSNTSSTLPLTIDNYDIVRQRMAAWTDDRGVKLGVMPDTILVPRSLERTAFQIFNPRANFEPGSAEFNSNLFSGLRVIVWDQLTDSNNWFAIDSTKMKRHLIWQARVPLEFAQEGDFDGIQVKYRGYERYGRGFSDWKWVYGCNP
jgi:phage major head subunit gpT-like protein